MSVECFFSSSNVSRSFTRFRLFEILFSSTADEVLEMRNGHRSKAMNWIKQVGVRVFFVRLPMNFGEGVGDLFWLVRVVIGSIEKVMINEFINRSSILQVLFKIFFYRKEFRPFLNLLLYCNRLESKDKLNMTIGT